MDEILLRLQLLIGNQIEDLQKNSVIPISCDKVNKCKSIDEQNQVCRTYLRAYNNVLDLVSKLLKDPNIKLVPFNGNWYTEDQINEMFNMHNNHERTE